MNKREATFKNVHDPHNPCYVYEMEGIAICIRASVCELPHPPAAFSPTPVINSGLSCSLFLILLLNLNGFGRLSENGAPGGSWRDDLGIIRKITPGFSEDTLPHHPLSP